MKKLLFTLLIAAGSQLLFLNHLNAQTGTWTALTNQAPHASNGLMLLLTDGTVICTNTTGTGYGTGWDKLTPDATGSYINGTWTSIASMNYDRFAFSSQVLPSGKVYVAGGEYGAGGTNGEVYDPVANTWTVCGNLPSGWNVYDGPSELLYTGNVLEGPEIGANGGQPCNSILQWNPATLDYINENAEPENHDEAAWIKLPDSTVLTIGMPYPNNPAKDSSCRFQPKTNTWLVDSMTPSNVYDQWGFESGGGYLLPNGKAIFFGATEYNVMYTPSGNSTTKGSWSSAANFPSIGGKIVSQPDAPGAMMVNGHILLAVSPEPTLRTEFATPTYFVEYDYTSNTFTQVTATLPTIGSDEFRTCISQNTGLLDLPDGNVLLCNNSSPNPNQYWVYTPGSAAIPQGKPTINSILPDGCPNYKLTGKLFNGISEGTGYGDDIQNSTNYPIIRLTNGTNVYYAKTTNWNRVGAVATDSLEDTVVFTVPVIPSGTYSLVVVANGFASNPTLFIILGISSLSATNVPCAGGTGSATITASGGLTPLTYTWSAGGNTGTTASNLGAGTYTVTVTDNNGCASSGLVTITQPAAISITADSANVVSGSCNGSAWAIVNGGTSPYTYSWTGGLTTDTITNQCAGNYCSTVTDANGCTQSVCVNIATTTGIENTISNTRQIKVYPNPSNGQFTIESLALSGRSSIEIYNVLGQNVINEYLRAKSEEINLTEQPNGVYFYRVIQEDGSLLGEGKLVIEK